MKWLFGIPEYRFICLVRVCLYIYSRANLTGDGRDGPGRQINILNESTGDIDLEFDNSII